MIIFPSNAPPPPPPYTNTCTPYLNATFAIPPHISASTTIDLQFIGNVAWSPGTPAVVQIWNNTITAVQVNGQVLHTTSYPTGTASEQVLYEFAIGFFILGVLVILYGLIKVRFAKRAQLPDINDHNGIPPLPY
ncbi:MAG: hypothetical protein ACP5OR_02690 [Candidatus Dormibacteria bacterium]